MRSGEISLLLSFLALLILGIDSAAFAQGTWSVATLSEARTHLAATSVGNKALFAGGEVVMFPMLPVPSDRVDIYDAATDSWSTTHLSEPRSNLAATTLGTKAFFAGGRAGTVLSARVDIYDSTLDSWSIAALSEAREGLAATAVGTKVLFAGGTESAVVDIYDAETDSWSTATLSQPRSYPAATAVGTKALFAGGLRSATVDIYDSATDAWSTATLSEARGHLAATTVGTKALFAGGGEPGSGFHSAVVDIYDAATDSWSTASLSQARRSLAATSVGDIALFAGGDFPTYPFWIPVESPVVDVYDKDTDSWSTATLSEARSRLTAVSVGNRAMFAGGGGIGEDPSSAVVDIFELLSLEWVCDLTPRFSDGTLILGFELGAPKPVHWNLFATASTSVGPVWSGIEIPVLQPPISYDVGVASLPRIGKIGLLTTFVTPDEGIVCSDFEVVDTGTP